jgi:hypothetical protein
MDYSLLLVIESCVDPVPKNNNQDEVDSCKRLKRKHLSTLNVNYSGQVYHFGIIDYLQTWNIPKRIERVTKSMFQPSNYKTISAVPPNLYS